MDCYVIFAAMRKNQFILAGLFSAYLLMLAHSIIPHHHHETKEEADRHHQSEHTTHHHYGEESEGHDHSTHYVHPSHYEDFVVSPCFKIKDISDFHLAITFIAVLSVQYSEPPLFDKASWFPDLPPPNLTYLPFPNGLRGSPIFVS